MIILSTPSRLNPSKKYARVAQITDVPLIKSLFWLQCKKLKKTCGQSFPHKQSTSVRKQHLDKLKIMSRPSYRHSYRITRSKRPHEASHRTIANVTIRHVKCSSSTDLPWGFVVCSRNEVKRFSSNGSTLMRLPRGYGRESSSAEGDFRLGYAEVHIDALRDALSFKYFAYFWYTSWYERKKCIHKLWTRITFDCFCLLAKSHD